jgi:UDP-glucose:O-linked fucose beta-1,3-glucosyltransferase
MLIWKRACSVFIFVLIRGSPANQAGKSSVDSSMHMSTKSDSNIESAAATVGDTSFSADSTSSQFKFSSAVDARANSQQAAAGTETKLSDIVVITRSQKNSFHLQLAKEQDEQWQQQFKFLKGKPAKLLKLHEEWAPEGAWTIFPLIRQLAALKAKWFFFCEDQTSVNFNGLLQILDQYSSKQSLLLGRGLQDSQTTIIHHYAFWDDPAEGISYPDFAAGWVMSRSLVKQYVMR